MSVKKRVRVYQSRVAPRRSEATVPLKGVFSPNTFLFFAIVVSFENQRCLSETAHTTSSNEIQPAEQNREPTRGGGWFGASAAAQLNSVLSTEIACRLRDVDWDGPFTRHSLCSSHSVRRASHLPIRNGAHHVAPHPVSLRRSCGAAAEGCVTITVHVPTPCRCSLLAASDPLSRSLTASVVGCFT